MIGKTLVKMVSSSEDEFPGPVGLRCFSMEFSEESIGTNRGHPRLSQIPIGWLINRGGRPLQHLIQLIDDRWYTGPSIFLPKGRLVAPRPTSRSGTPRLWKLSFSMLGCQRKHPMLPDVARQKDMVTTGGLHCHGGIPIAGWFIIIDS